MNKRLLGKTGFQISSVSYGGIVSASLYERYAYTGDGQGASDHFVSWAVEQGVNYFDVAPVYGNAQETMGNSLKLYRKNIYLACKTNKRKRAAAEKDLETSMKLLHIDYFDIYQLHGLIIMEELETAFAPGGTMELYDFDTVLFPFNWHMEWVTGFLKWQKRKMSGFYV